MKKYRVGVCLLFCLLLVLGWVNGSTISEDVVIVGNGGGPVVVATGVSSVACAWAYKGGSCFWEANRFWLFYQSGSKVYYTSSSDGVSWSDPAVAVGIYRTDSNGFDVFSFSGFVHIAFRYSWNSGGVIRATANYRRGQLFSNGTIDFWWKSYYVAKGTKSYHNPSVAVDGSGHAWVGYGKFMSTGPAYVSKNSRTDSVWETASGFPYGVTSQTLYKGWGVTLIPLSGNKMYVVAGHYSGVYGRLYTGSGWDPEETLVSQDLWSYKEKDPCYGHVYGSFSAVADSNDQIYVAVLNENYEIVFREADGQLTTLVSGLSSKYAAPQLCIDPDTDTIFLLYAEENKIYLMRRLGYSSWSDPQLILEESEGITFQSAALQVSRKLINGKIVMAYRTDSQNLKFFQYSLNQPPTQPTLTFPEENARFDPSASVTFTWTFNDPDAGDSQSAYQFQLDDNSDFASPIIDTGKVTSSESSTTQTLPSTVGLYYWRVKTWDSQDAEGEWSNAKAIIVDRIKIIAGGVVNFTIDVDVGGKVWYYAVYEYDNATFNGSCGVLYLNGFEMTWDGEQWIYAFPYSTEGNQMTFHITGVLDNQYGLTTINNQAGDIIINWATMTIEIKK